MLENVRNLTAHDGGNTFRIIKEHLEDLGYNVYVKVLNAWTTVFLKKESVLLLLAFWMMWISHFPILFQNQRERLSQIFWKIMWIKSIM